MIRLATTPSTNDVLRRLAAEGAPHGTAVLAEAQTAGRGRLGRRWESPPGVNVYLSVLVRRPHPFLPLAAAVATAEACGGAYRIKWPNDVLAADGRKVAGVLCEAEWEGGAFRFAVVGVGVNVKAAPDLPTASFLEADGTMRDRDRVAEAVRDGLLAWLERDPPAVLATWRARSATLGTRVRVGDVEGRAVDVDETGALLVDAGAGLFRVVAGEVG